MVRGEWIGIVGGGDWCGIGAWGGGVVCDGDGDWAVRDERVWEAGGERIVDEGIEGGRGAAQGYGDARVAEMRAQGYGEGGR